MGYKPTGKPAGRPRKDGLPAGGMKQEGLMAEAQNDSGETVKPEASAPLTMTQEQLQAIVGSAVLQTRTEVMGDVVKMLAGANASGSGATDMSAMISELTVQIASMADGGENRKKIPPVEAKRREAARERMGDVLTRIQSDPKAKPHYRLVKEMWLDDVFLEANVPDGESKWKPNEIIWRGVPNAGMRPMNPLAVEIYEHYLASIGGTTKNQAGVRDQPIWVTYGGLQMASNGSASASTHGLVIPPAEPMTLGTNLPTTNELTTPDDPNAAKIRILGKTVAPAERTAPGKVPTLQQPFSN